MDHVINEAMSMHKLFWDQIKDSNNIQQMTKVQLKYTTVQKATLEKIPDKPYSDSQRTEQIVKVKKTMCLEATQKRK